MPLYDLICECGYTEENTQITVADYERATCPKCKGKLRSNSWPTTFRVLDSFLPRSRGEVLEEARRMGR